MSEIVSENGAMAVWRIDPAADVTGPLNIHPAAGPATTPSLAEPIGFGMQAESLTAGCTVAPVEQHHAALPAKTLSPERSNRSLYRKALILSGAILSVTCAVGSVTVRVQHENHTNAEPCSTVDQTALSRADKLLNSEEYPGLQTLLSWRKQQANPNNWETYREFKKHEFEYQRATAIKHGLSVNNYWPYVHYLEKDLYQVTNPQAPTNLPIERYLESAQEFLDLYGIQLRIANEQDTLGFEFKPPTQAELSTTQTKQNILNLLRFIGSQPVEFVTEGGTREYILAAGQPIPNPHNPSSDEKVMIAAYKVAANNGPIVLNIAVGLDERTYAHETGHGLDYETCEGDYGMNHDSGYNALNGGHDYTGDMTQTNGSLSFENSKRKMGELSKAYVDATAAQRTTDIARINAEVNSINTARPHTTYLSDYSESAIGEDKAEVYSLLTRIVQGEITYAQIQELDCPLRQKLIYLTARLMSHSKTGARAVQYFAELNIRHQRRYYKDSDK